MRRSLLSARRPRRAALALALAATSALTAPGFAAHAQPAPQPAVVSVAPADSQDRAAQAEHAVSESRRPGAWRAVAGVMGAIGSGAGAVWMLLRRLGASKIVRPVARAAAATARAAVGGATLIGRAGLRAGRAVIGALIAGLVLLLAAAGLASAGPGAALIAGIALGAALTGAAVWMARRLLFRRRGAAA